MSSEIIFSQKQQYRGDDKLESQMTHNQSLLNELESVQRNCQESIEFNLENLRVMLEQVQQENHALKQQYEEKFEKSS